MKPFPALVCPRCRATLDPEGGEGDVDRCAACGLTFAQHHGVPLLVDGAGHGEMEAWQKAIYDAFTHLSHGGWALGRGPDITLTYWSHSRRIAALRPSPGATVLDVGCLDGRRLFEIAASFDVIGVGIDLSTASVRTARAARHLRLRFHAASAEALPLPDGACEIAVAMDVLEHLADPARAVREVRRCLKPGGRFLAHVPVVDNAGSLDAWMAEHRPDAWAARVADAGHDYKRMPSSGALRAWFEAAGFVDVRLSRFNAWHQNRFDYCTVHRVLNTLFFVWGVPIPLYHSLLVHAAKLWYWLDTARLRRGVGGSVYIEGRVRHA